MKVLITGSQGFIGHYICDNLLKNNFEVIGVDNYQKYGFIKRHHDNHPNFKLYELNLSEKSLDKILEIEKPDVIIANAAVIGGLEYINKFPYTLYTMNEKILLNTIEPTLEYYKNFGLKKFIYMSSSYVFQHVQKEQFEESDLQNCPFPDSPYAFQKLSGEIITKAACEQFGLPFTIIRPFNCIGLGEENFENTNFFHQIKTSHVLTDFIFKILKNEKPLNIWGTGKQTRTFTHCEDLANAIRLVIDSDKSLNEDFNVCGDQSISIIELAEYLWKLLRKDDFEYISQDVQKYDVQKREASNRKIKKLLNFEIKNNLFSSIEEIAYKIKNNYEK